VAEELAENMAEKMAERQVETLAEKPVESRRCKLTEMVIEKLDGREAR